MVFGKEGTLNQKRAAKLSGAQRAFPINSYVGVTFPYNIKGRVENYRLIGDKPIDEVEIQIDGKWYHKSAVTKSVAVLRAIKNT